MQNLLQDLLKLLEQDDRLVVEGQLLKNKIVELALGLDSGLIRLLLSHEVIRRHFFAELDGVFVFDKIKFQQFVNNKEFLPDSYTAFKNKIGLTADGHYLTDSKEVVLAWPYKDCVLEGGQTKEDAKRDEVFWNETLAPDQIDRLLYPKVLTKFKKFDKDGEHKVASIDHDDNLIIKGNNLLALHTLKASSYAGRIKLIYVDPPYNTGDDDFLYNDSFSQSTWLTFMKNRIEVAKSLLAPDGLFIMQLSDHRTAEGKLLLDQIFGRENFINQVTVKTRSPSGFKTVNLGVYESAEYLYFYAAENKKAVKYNTQYVASSYDNNYKYILERKGNDPAKWKIIGVDTIISNELGFEDVRTCKKSLGRDAFEIKMAEYALSHSEKVFRYTEINNDASREAVALREKSKKDPNKIFWVHDNTRELFVQGGKQIYFYANKIRNIDGVLTPTMLLTNIWTDISWEGIASEGGVKLKKGKKPERLLRRILNMFSRKGDIILDFYAGSGTTAAVAHKMGRQFIALEQLDYGQNDAVVRLQNVISGDLSGISKVENWQGGGSFVYCELAKANQTFLDHIQDAKTVTDLKTIWEDMQNKAFLSYKIDPKTIGLDSANFQTLSLDDQKCFLIEVMDKNMLYVSLSEIDDETHGVSAEDKKLNRLFFGQA